MIVDMKKLTLLMSAKDRGAALNRLRSLGVLHVRYIQPPESDEIEQLFQEASNIEKALNFLDDKAQSGKSTTTKQAASMVQQILDLVHERNSLIKDLEEQKDIYSWFERWGSVSLASIRALEESGLCG